MTALEGEFRVLLKQMEDALRFYGTEAHWHSSSTGFALQYDPEPSLIEADQGKRARRVLKEIRAANARFTVPPGENVAYPTAESLQDVRDGYEDGN